jgi:hypothetical protein
VATYRGRDREETTLRRCGERDRKSRRGIGGKLILAEDVLGLGEVADEVAAGINGLQNTAITASMGRVNRLSD